jgi:hypothetical protein
VRVISEGGIGAMHLLVKKIGLDRAINEGLKLLKRHRPYLESDHVLNIAYNVLSGGQTLEDIELRRQNQGFLDALGAQAIPDPTTAGDFCRRFRAEDIEDLMRIVNEKRLDIWRMQPNDFFEQAVIDADGTFVPTTGECKDGMDVNFKGTWGYHVLLVSLANTQEPLFLVNRPGNRPSQEGAAVRLDAAAELCRRAGFRSILLRGDTDFSQTRHLDRWNEQGIQFVFGYDAMAPLRNHADSLEESAWQRLERSPRYIVETEPRERPDNVKERIVREREFENIRLMNEDVAEFTYRPGACEIEYRIVVVRKNLSREKGDSVLFDEIRYFFYITNDWMSSPATIVFTANHRCDQERLIGQLKSEVHSLRAPVDNLESNWAYMVIASLGWSVKAWFALILPVTPRWEERHRIEKREVLRMSFRRFVDCFIRIPAQIISHGRQLRYRFLSWNPWQHIFFRALNRIQQLT